MIESNISLSQFRELSPQEIDVVAGGFDEGNTMAGSDLLSMMQFGTVFATAFVPEDMLGCIIDTNGNVIGDLFGNWLSSMPIIITAPSGMDAGNGYTIVHHNDGSGLISLFYNGQFVTGLQPATADTATFVFTVQATAYSAHGGIGPVGGGGSTSGGPIATLYYQPGL